MAATSIWPVKGDIGHLLRYIQDPGKADGQQLVSGISCAPDISMDEMNTVKRQFGKTGGIVAFHGYQSFAPGEVTPEIAHQIGILLATELWGDRFQVVVATHVDKGHIHNHFAINSVSYADGKRFHSGARDLHRLQETSDRLCREYGLSVIENPKKGDTKNHAEYTAEKNGQPTWRSLIQSDIDQAIAASMTERQFFLPSRRWAMPIRLARIYQYGHRARNGFSDWNGIWAFHTPCRRSASVWDAALPKRLLPWPSPCRCENITV